MNWSALFGMLISVAFLVWLWPRAMHMIKNSPEAEPGDWQSVALPIIGVIAFVGFLIAMV